jgi:hypothetical protein
MPQGDVEVFHKGSGDDRWRLRVEGGEILDGDYTTKDEAVRAGREEAERRGSELIVKNQDGTIADKSSHGNDPRDIPG